MVQRLIVLMVIGLVGCAPQTQPPVRTTNCAGWREIRPSREDVLTRGTIDQILAHNEYGAEQGCWAAP
jgi:hypothetical protein